MAKPGVSLRCPHGLRLEGGSLRGRTGRGRDVQGLPDRHEALSPALRERQRDPFRAEPVSLVRARAPPAREGAGGAPAGGGVVRARRGARSATGHRGATTGSRARAASGALGAASGALTVTDPASRLPRRHTATPHRSELPGGRHDRRSCPARAGRHRDRRHRGGAGADLRQRCGGARVTHRRRRPPQPDHQRDGDAPARRERDRGHRDRCRRQRVARRPQGDGDGGHARGRGREARRELLGRRRRRRGIHQRAHSSAPIRHA